jgi:GNAT superfamily N-acetyltransferase
MIGHAPGTCYDGFVKDTGHLWRPIRKDDVFGLTRLEQLCSQQDGISHQYGDHGWETKFKNAADLAKDGVVTIDGNGDVLAFALVTYELRPNEAHAYLEGRVIPALRRRGVGTALIEWSWTVPTRVANAADDEVRFEYAASSRYRPGVAAAAL